MRAIILLLIFVLASPARGLTAETWALQRWERAFDYSSQAIDFDYTPLERARQNWQICVAYPHLKDAYWLSVNFGMAEEARRLGVSFRLVEAGGYPNLARQIEQVEDCVAKGADALIVGTVSFRGLTETVTRIAERMPVIAAVNDIADDGIAAKSGVSWTQMGAAAGRVIAERHPKGGDPVRIAWFPGPQGAGWVTFVEEGFKSELANSSAEIAVTKWGDTGREIQVLLVEEALDEAPEIDYIVGTAPTAEAAVSILRARGLSDRVKIVSDYMTHAVFRGIRRGRILAAPTDFPITQGRLAIEQAVRAIEGSLEISHAGPQIVMVDESNIESIGAEGSLAPATFVPIFQLGGL